MDCYLCLCPISDVSQSHLKSILDCSYYSWERIQGWEWIRDIRLWHMNVYLQLSLILMALCLCLWDKKVTGLDQMFWLRYIQLNIQVAILLLLIMPFISWLFCFNVNKVKSVSASATVANNWNVVFSRFSLACPVFFHFHRVLNPLRQNNRKKNERKHNTSIALLSCVGLLSEKYVTQFGTRQGRLFDILQQLMRERR